jgi:hypothetical protein
MFQKLKKIFTMKGFYMIALFSLLISLVAAQVTSLPEDFYDAAAQVRLNSIRRWSILFYSFQWTPSVDPA